MTALEFNNAVAGHQRTLRPIAMKLTRNSEQANDLIQDTFLKAIANKDKFRDGTHGSSRS